MLLTHKKNTKVELQLTHYSQTVHWIFRFGYRYFKQLLQPNKFNVNIALLSPIEFFDFVQSKEYVKDKGEHLSSPEISIDRAGTGHYFDCDDRAILAIAYFLMKNYLLGYDRYKIRVNVTGRAGKDRPHHVFIDYCDTKVDPEKWITFDPTYPRNVYGKHLFIPAGYYQTYTYDPKKDKIIPIR
ncbi:MAG: hypothetical protein AAF518_14450 [Spirochaetota bacterium]